eukprot:4168447-Alexandrium_andersonii.AAC.1
MDFDNQKGLWQHSLSMHKNKKYIPVVKEGENTSTTQVNTEPEGQPTEDSTQPQEDFDDSAFEKDLSDAEMT